MRVDDSAGKWWNELNCTFTFQIVIKLFISRHYFTKGSVKSSPHLRLVTRRGEKLWQFFQDFGNLFKFLAIFSSFRQSFQDFSQVIQDFSHVFQDFSKLFKLGCSLTDFVGCCKQNQLVVVKKNES